MAYEGRRELNVTFDAAQGARWDDFDTCLGVADAVGTVAEGAAVDCSNRYGLNVTVLRLTGSEEVVAAGFCCNTIINVQSVSSSCIPGNCTSTCDSCTAIPGNSAWAKDADCAPCATGQSWWPCNVNPNPCQCDE